MENIEGKQYCRSIFSPNTSAERAENFDHYWEYIQNHCGQINEADKKLERKQAQLQKYQVNEIRTQSPLPNPDRFYQNYVKLREDPKTFDPKTLLLTCIYKLARHEWVGISAAWDLIPSLTESTNTIDKINRYHLCEEFSHIHFFQEIFRTVHLEEVEWVPLGKVPQKLYRIFPMLPSWFMNPIAFVTELMGITFYIHVDQLLDSIFEDEPIARERIRELLYEIMIDEAAHIGLRRNFLGPRGVAMSEKIVSPMFRAFFHDIPESKYLLNIDQMIQDALNFDYSILPCSFSGKNWTPSYLKR